MRFEVEVRTSEIPSAIQGLAGGYKDSRKFLVDTYALAMTGCGTLLLTFNDKDDRALGALEVDNTPHNNVTILRLLKEALWEHGDNGKLIITTYYNKEGYVEDHIEFTNWFSKYSFKGECVSTKPAEALKAINEQYMKDVEENTIQIEIHSCIQDRIMDTETYFLKSPTDMWARLDTDETLGVLTAKPVKLDVGEYGANIVIGSIEPSGRYTHDLGCEISKKLKPFLEVFRKIDVKHERAKLIASEVYSSRTAYEENEMSCLRLELYVEDIESSVGKIEKVEIFI